MGIPATPQNFYAQTGNRQGYVSWDLVPGATSYDVQRSIDGITFASIATPVVPYHLDTTTLVGVRYYYQVASTNASGTSPYTPPQLIIPSPTGEMSLGQLRLMAKQRADREESDFVTLPEWNANIVQSCFELYDLLITQYEDDYVADPVTITMTGNTNTFPLPDGVNYNASRPFYKLLGVDLATNTAQNAWVTIKRFNFSDRNKYIYPNSNSTIYGVFNMQYRPMGNQIQFIPQPTGGQYVRLWYIPRMTQLLQDTDLTDISISGWIEYVIVDAAMKALIKEEADISALLVQKNALIKRIQDSESNRDAGQPDTISNTRDNNGFGGGGWGGAGPVGGW